MTNITIEKEKLQKVFYALTAAKHGNLDSKWTEEVLAICKQALEQPVQEPVAWVDVKDTHHGPYEFHGKELLPAGKHDLYTNPPAQPPATAVQELQRYSPNGEGGMEVDSLGAYVKHQDVSNPPAPVPLTQAWRDSAQWLRNNYQDHPNIASLCDAMIEYGSKQALEQPAMQQPYGYVGYVFTNVQSGDIESSTDPDHKQDERELWYREELVRQHHHTKKAMVVNTNTPEPAPVAWTGCGECDCSFPCHEGGTACIRNDLWLYWKVDDKSVVTGPFKTHSKVEAYGLDCIDQTPLTVPAAQVLAVQEPVIQRVMSRLADLLDEDQFKEIEGMVVVAGCTPPTPPAPVPLTDGQINKLRQQYGVTSDGRGIKEFTNVVDFARAIEAAHNITKGGAA